MEQLLDKVISAIEYRCKEFERQKLQRLLDLDASNEQTWLSLESITEGSQQKREILTHILLTNPGSQKARERLALLDFLSNSPIASPLQNNSFKHILLVCWRKIPLIMKLFVGVGSICGALYYAFGYFVVMALMHSGTRPNLPLLMVRGIAFGGVSGFIIYLVVDKVKRFFRKWT